MNSNLKWKGLAILAVVALAVFSFYPPQQKVRLGLDLKGGVHLVMRVQTDDALKVETEAVAERLREDFTTKNIAFTSIAAQPPDKVVISGVQNEQAFRAASDEITAASYDRSGGSGTRGGCKRPAPIAHSRWFGRRHHPTGRHPWAGHQHRCAPRAPACAHQAGV